MHYFNFRTLFIINLFLFLTLSTPNSITQITITLNRHATQISSSIRRTKNLKYFHAVDCSVLFSICICLNFLHLAIIIRTLLLKSGIEPNPGPTHLCGVCAKTINKTGSVLCQKCSYWIHTRCSNLTDINDYTANYSCPKCSNTNSTQSPNTQYSTTPQNLTVVTDIMTVNQNNDQEESDCEIDYESLKNLLKSYTDNVKYTLINFANLSNKFHEYKMLVTDLGHNNILGICETFFDDNIDSKPWQVDSSVFEVFRNDRDKEATGLSKGGGVLILVPTMLKPKQRPDLNILTRKHFESLWVEMDYHTETKTTRCLVNLAYSPNKNLASTFLNEMIANVNKVLTENKPLVLMGDYNIDYLSSVDKSKLDTLLSLFDLHVSNSHTPTRQTAHSATLIDHILTDNPEDFQCFITDPPIRTDHKLSICIQNNCITHVNDTQKITVYSKRNYSKNSFNKDLKNAEWFHMYKCPDAESMLEWFDETFSRILRRNAPLQSVRVKTKTTHKNSSSGNKPYITDECRSLGKQKKALHKAFRKNKNTVTYNQYKCCRNKHNSLLKQCSTEFEKNNFLSFDNERDKWNFINNLRQSKKLKTKIECLVNCFEDKVTETKKIANYLNYKFALLGNYLGPQLDIDKFELKTNKKFSFRYITEQECMKNLLLLNTAKPMGPSTIPAWALKDAAPTISTHLSFVINAFLTERKFPERLKSADVCPIFKKGLKTDPTNYRPVSITSALAKIFERLLTAQIDNYLSENKLYSPYQFGFRKKFSTTEALLFATENFRSNIDDGNLTAIALLDLSKAFDSINHPILKQKLQSLGFDEPSLQLLSSFLCDRNQRVKLGNTFSDWYTINQGVPQGTVLGPLLFNLYVNDLDTCLTGDCKLVQYADDTCIFVSGKNIAEITTILGKNTEHLTTYYQKHSLSLNLEKTQFIVLCSKSKNALTTDTRLHVFDTKIDQSQSVKYLGVSIDKHLTLEQQVNNVLRKMAVGIKTISAIRETIPLKSRILLLHSLVLSHFKYASPLFTCLSCQLLHKLNVQLNWGLRICYFKPKRYSATELKLRTKIMPIEKQIDILVLQKFWKLIHSQWQPFKLLAFPNYSITTNERTGALRTINHYKTNVLKHSFLNTAVRLWNELPNSVKDRNEFQSFKQTINTHFFKTYSEYPHDRIINNAWNDFIIR